MFRKDGDSGKQRTEASPEPVVISAKLERFAEKWKHARDHTGKEVFTHDTFEAIRKLQSHISIGCLSNIPKGGGTN